MTHEEFNKQRVYIEQNIVEAVQGIHGAKFVGELREPYKKLGLAKSNIEDIDKDRTFILSTFIRDFLNSANMLAQSKMHDLVGGNMI